MKYISEERLWELFDQYKAVAELNCSPLRVYGMLDMLEMVIDECKELNHWQPIESAPKDETTIMLYFPDKPPCVGFWSYVSRNWCLFSTYRETRPTHWAEILEPPFHKEK